MVIRNPSPKATNAELIDETTILVTFDVNIEGPNECHSGDQENKNECCIALFATNNGILSLISSTEEGKNT